jgi:orotidine-5'-phosphate decarboxylase
MHWGDTVRTKVDAHGPLVLGIDPSLDHAPAALASDPAAFLERYTRALLDGAEGKVAFIKFQSAYFEAWGSAGVASLARCIAIARERKFAVILDAKRGTSDRPPTPMPAPTWSRERQILRWTA